ncbi:C4-dicarboxylate ABC transporter permease [Saccharomonospora sp. CUA-673]|uniref:TRAP transporter large permease n=1 Tax=Saccharomonospora sp. CUA-673 TaxID=1904969 RepID=UPI000960CAD8|nr:TRAP transporter large permease [Saccharomonospora sp. CUA-673]OLT46996.1 C4-dicarboxylate ABC transporter permease [Saccharomonospora sp. CUA-673]
MIGAVLFASFFVLLLLGVPVAFALGVAACVALVAMGGFTELSLVPNVFTASVSSETLLAIPFFILAGVIMEYAGISRRLVDFAHACVGGRKHGLAIVVVLAAFFFSAISGSGPATVAAIGTILIPALMRHGYRARHATSLLATAGSMGLIVPPSVAFIIFAVVVSDFEGVSIVRLFVAGIIPGILLAAALMIASLFLPRRQVAAPARVGVGGGGGADTESGAGGDGSDGTEGPGGSGVDGGGGAALESDEPARGFGASLVKAIPGLLVPLIILGGIYGGIVTPTESAVVAAAYALIVGLLVYREIQLRQLYRILVTASAQSAVIMLIVGAASVFAYVVTANEIAESISAALLGLTDSRALIVLLAIVLLLIVGAFIDAVSALYLFVPVIAPVLLAAGVDVTTIGVLMVVNLALGLVTPPVGVNLFVAAGIARVPLVEVVKGIRPFFLAGLAVVLLVAYVPALSNWLPDLLGF